MSKRILFFGNERIATGVTTACPVLRGLVAAGYDIAAVVVAQKAAGKSRTSRPLEIENTAAELGIPLIAPDKLSEAADELKSYEAEAAVLVAYGKIVPEAIIDIFSRGIINIHPSLLPKHRGSAPIESVILRGETETGVSLMQLAVAMDAGPVYAQATHQLGGAETKQELADTLAQIGADMLIRHLPAILDGSRPPESQHDDLATYDNRIAKDAGQLDPQLPAEVLERQIRAYAGWPRSRTALGTTEVTITKAHIDPLGNGAPGSLWMNGPQLGLYTKKGVLVIDALIPNGKKEMDAASFLAGYQP